MLVLAELAMVSDLSEPHLIRHYLYFPTCNAAEDVAGVLGRGGYRTEARLSADVDEESWLVLAEQEAVLTPEFIASTRGHLEALAAGAGGEYDGWEAEVQQEAPASD
jgi:hypothetical protein